MTDNGPPDRHWHLDKRVNVTHILTTLAMVVALFSWGSKVEERIAVIEHELKLRSERYSEQFNEIRQSLYRIEAKLDGKQDRRQ